MGHGGDALHLDRVHFLEGVVEDTWCIDNLPTQVLVVEMTDKEGFCGESVWLHVDICARDLVDEGGLADVGISTDQECTGIWVDRG